MFRKRSLLGGCILLCISIKFLFKPSKKKLSRTASVTHRSFAVSLLDESLHTWIAYGQVRVTLTREKAALLTGTSDVIRTYLYRVCLIGDWVSAIRWSDGEGKWIGRASAPLSSSQRHSSAGVTSGKGRTTRDGRGRTGYPAELAFRVTPPTPCRPPCRPRSYFSPEVTTGARQRVVGSFAFVSPRHSQPSLLPVASPSLHNRHRTTMHPVSGL